LGAYSHDENGNHTPYQVMDSLNRMNALLGTYNPDKNDNYSLSQAMGWGVKRK
jgi:hypothetical protein